jgi:hypothetical protein
MDKSLDFYKETGKYIQLRNQFERFNTNINTKKVQDTTKGCKEPLIQKLFNKDTMTESGNNRKYI